MAKVETVAILGASPKPARASNEALHLLLHYGYRPIPVNPVLKVIEGIPAVARLSEIEEAVDTLTVYVGPELSTSLADEISELRPCRVIFNPGTENPALRERLE